MVCFMRNNFDKRMLLMKEDVLRKCRARLAEGPYHVGCACCLIEMVKLFINLW